MRISEAIETLELLRNQFGNIYVENENGVTVEIAWSDASGTAVVVIS